MRGEGPARVCSYAPSSPGRSAGVIRTSSSAFPRVELSFSIAAFLLYLSAATVGKSGSVLVVNWGERKYWGRCQAGTMTNLRRDSGFGVAWMRRSCSVLVSHWTPGESTAIVTEVRRPVAIETAHRWSLAAAKSVLAHRDDVIPRSLCLGRQLCV